MCAIGCILKNGKIVSKQEVWHQLESMRHRGPDGQQVITSGSLGLCHARLAIQDLGDAGRQPMVRNGHSLVFNGEIYNFLELKEQLIKNYNSRFAGTGDAEVLFEGLIQEGLEFIKKLNGDFAIAWHDGQSSKLHLIRDRLGVKPLYYRKLDGVFQAASEVRGLFQKHEVPEEDTSAMNSFYALRYVRGSRTAFLGVKKVAPGTIVTVDASLESQIQTYWTPFEDRPSWSYSEFLRILEDSIKIRMRSQVDVGILLSGGMDSTLLAKLASDASHSPLKGFTCELPGSENSKKDLSRAKKFARQNNMTHFTYRYDHDLLVESLNAIEEPIGDSIVGPLMGVIGAAKGHVKVLLSGEGADEIFAGYGHHYFLNGLWSTPSSFRKTISAVLPFVVQVSETLLHRLYPAHLGEEEVSRLKKAFSQGGDFASAYHSIVEIFDLEQRRRILGESADSLESETREIVSQAAGLSPIKKLIYLELKTWLCSYNLLKLDKITGWHGMEGRVPYLDHRLVEMIFAAPDHLLMGLFERKPIMRDLCKGHSIPCPVKIPFTYQSNRHKRSEKGFLKSKQEDLVKIHQVWTKKLEGM